MERLPLEPGEKIVLICHKHWLAYAFNTFISFVLLILPYALYRTLGFATDVSFTARTTELITFFYLGWFLFLWLYFFIAWTNVYLDKWIVTDRRIIDIEQERLFSRKVSDFRIEKIQNISVEERGFWANMLGFGNIHVETAGEHTTLRFDMLPDPSEVRDLISENHDRCLARLSHDPFTRDLATGE